MATRAQGVGINTSVYCTLGDHLRKRRLDLGLFQPEVADRLGADTCTVTNWELRHTEPELRFLPGIVRFLGYTPWTGGGSIGDQLLAYRRKRGLPQSALAHLLGVDPGTLSRWERGRRWPRHELLGAWRPSSGPLAP